MQTAGEGLRSARKVKAAPMNRTFTIGFTGKSAAQFFGLLRSQPDLQRVIDVRLHNTSQLSGFAKRADLKFFLDELCGVEYLHLPELAPTGEILHDYQKGDRSWERYRERFLDLLARRNIERGIARDVVAGGCLLCSEHQPHHCHRRLIVEYLQNAWGCDLHVVHLCE